MTEWKGQKLLKSGKYGANKKLTIDQVANEIWGFGDREFEDMKRDGVVCGHYGDYYIYGPYTKELEDKVKEIRKRKLGESMSIKKLTEEISKVLNESGEYKLTIITDRDRSSSGELTKTTINAKNDADALLQVFLDFNLQNSPYINGEYEDELPEEEVARNNKIREAAETGNGVDEAVKLLIDLYEDNLDISDYYDNIVKLEAPDGHTVIDENIDTEEWFGDEDIEDEE